MKLLPRLKSADPSQPVKLWPFVVALTAIIGLGLAVFTVSAGLLWLGLERPRLDTGKPLTTKDQLDLVRIALIVTGGLGGVVALVVAYRKQRIAEDTNRREEQAAEREKEASRREDTKLFNERFITASAQLGHDSAAVRLAGVYAIASLADDWEAGRQTCIDVLCAYIRMPYQPKQSEPGWKEGERQVRLSIISMISDHLRPVWNRVLPLWKGNHFDFTGATIDGGDFKRVDFTDCVVRFDRATFTQNWEDTVSFQDAIFAGIITYDHASFAGALVDFEGAKFAGPFVAFQHADFVGGWVLFDRANFAGGDVTFYKARLIGTKISLKGATYSGGTVNFSQVKDFKHPPAFDDWVSPPVGLMLPTETRTSGPDAGRQVSAEATKAGSTGEDRATADDDSGSSDGQPAP